MRYLLLLFILLVVATLALFGTRGNTSRKPALYLFGDMDRQPKLRPQADSPLFPDGRTSRLPPPGTIARSEPVVAGSQEVYPFEDNPVNTGRVPGTTNYVELIPLPITDRLMSRGQERFNIYCAPCHGPAGDGKSAISKLGMGVIADLHDTKTRRVVQQTDGQLFETITFGRNLMGPYGGIIPVEDRWAIVAYVRALQRSRLASTEDIPQNERLRLPGGTAPPPQPAAAPAQPAAPPKPQ